MSGPPIPKEMTGPNSGSSIVEIVTGTPGRALRCTTKPARLGSVISSLSELHADRMSSAESMLRHTCARSGRSRRFSEVAFSTTSQPSDSPAVTASSSDCTG